MIRSWLDYVTGPSAPERRADLAGWGLCWLRVSTGLMMLLAHGWPKLANFSTLAKVFPDPLGVGSTASLLLAVFA